MARTNEITFIKNLSDGTPASVGMDITASLVLRDLMLFGIVNYSQKIPTLGKPAGTGVYEERATFLRILDRLDCRPFQTAGRAKMCIGKIRLTVGEVSLIENSIKQMLGFTDSQIKSALRYSGSGIKVTLQRHYLERILFLISEESNVKSDKVHHSTKSANNPQ